ncbi:CFI-box-CTERM domain-containing protein [Janthinobacterium sp. GW458P]|uniref:CFI-box-CTERM domain-containing protein n=1 Tax=Janthinobacterium sp. GW458P TaxID=1981504 RepID=UPI0011213B9B|nr:CFI-box-CTERM domain-containing protein [Janthinobacterium sp. GW458P]MBE3025553.1 hypothetical protein [Janthinobacterium sp. GW458P]
MALAVFECTQCGANLDVEDQASTFTCPYCHNSHERSHEAASSPTPQTLCVMAERSIAKGIYGKAMQYVEQGLLLDPYHAGLLDLEIKARDGLSQVNNTQAARRANEAKLAADKAESDQYHYQAKQMMRLLRENKKIYGTNIGFKVPQSADMDLALQYIDRSLELFPENPIALNLKGLILWEGHKKKDEARAFLEKAAQLAPRNIDIQNNLASINSSACFIATAAFGTPFASEINVLRHWRDRHLLQSIGGRWFVACYYRTSPPFANFIATRPTLKRLVRWLLQPLLTYAAVRLRKGHRHSAPGKTSRHCE